MPLTAAQGEELPAVRVGSLAAGTLDWELKTIDRLALDRKHGFRLETVEMADNPGALIAMQGGAVEVIVTDWLWVSNQRARGKGVVAVPYSSAVGAVVVGKSKAMRTIEDLRGKKLGIAGGPQDKNWLLLRALAIRRNGEDLNGRVETVFGAPPLIAKALEKGDLDAAILFWPFAARLNAKGYATLIDGNELMRGVGLTDSVPLLVYAFTGEYAQAHPERVRAVVDAAYEAKRVLLNSDDAWQPLRLRMGAEDDATFHALVAAWRAGVPQHWNERDLDNARTLYRVLHEIGGRDLVEGESLDPGTFWPAFGH